ncbi:hypothetical protein [Acidicapsa ligni]|uniref:hypothetical protein n=1 Tax=Acidicapsa ligni TaxID=542300 RepID=UPI0021DF9A8E|nr:hypothetical protein [Acidicapsa ligni]
MRMIGAAVVALAIWFGTVPALASATPARNEAQARQQYSERLGVARDAYFKVITNNDRDADRRAHAALAEFEREYPGDPIGKAYHGSLQLLDAAHDWAIWNLHKEAAEGLSRLDEAVTQAPDEPEVRFIRAATSWHLPSFYHRKAQYESDFALLAPHAEEDARDGRIPPALAAAALNYWGQILVGRKDNASARAAFATAIRIAPQSPGAVDAGLRLRQLR